MSQEIINVLDYIAEKLGIAVDWTAENVWPQVMEILSRYRIYEIVSNVIGIIVSAIIIVVFAWLFKCTFKAYKECKADHTDNLFWEWYHYSEKASPEYLTIAIFTLAFVFGSAVIITIMVDVSDLLKWIIIPEIQILDLLQGYVK